MWNGAGPEQPIDERRVVVPDRPVQRGCSVRLSRARVDSLLEQGYEDIDLFVTRANEPAVRLYEALGFRDVEGWSLPE